MTLFALLAVLILGGVGLYCLNTFVSMAPNVKKLINVLVTTVLVILVLAWLLAFLGINLHRQVRF